MNNEKHKLTNWINDEKSKPRLSFTHYERHFYLKAVEQTRLFSPGSLERFSLDVLVSLLRQENAADICVIKVPEQIKYTDYFIVVSGVSTRHLRAMALYTIKVVTNIQNLMLCFVFVLKTDTKGYLFFSV